MDFKALVSNLDINLNDEMMECFEKYYNNLILVNSYMNLTAITDYDEVYIKHFYDSLTILKAINKNNINLCDVGSGAGFPSIPLAIVRKDINVTIIDALNKRINFLNDLSKKLELDNVKAYHKRAEDYKEGLEAFDVVTARAVARLNILAELCMPLVKVGGIFIAMKGKELVDELEEASSAINILGGKIRTVINLDLPNDSGKRAILVIEKIKNSPSKYPRSFAKIKEKPL